MTNKSEIPVNRIEDCLSQAISLNKKIRHQPRFFQIFKNLARDETTGLMAYAIWRTRSKLFSVLHRASDNKQSEANAPRVSQARSCWQMESVAFSDLSH